MLFSRADLNRDRVVSGPPTPPPDPQLPTLLPSRPKTWDNVVSD